MDTTNIRKKIQYITVDSEFVQGSNNTFTVNLGNINRTTTSNVLLQNMRNVIGLKLVDFFVYGDITEEETSSVRISSKMKTGMEEVVYYNGENER